MHDTLRSARFGLVLFTDSFGLDVTSSDVLAWSLDYARDAEEHGWDELWTTEHHFTRHAQNPSALAMAAFLLGRTGLADKRALLDEHAAVASEHGHAVDPRDNADSAYLAVDEDVSSARQRLTDGLADFLHRVTLDSIPLVERPRPTATQTRAEAEQVADRHIAGDVAGCRKQLAERVDTLGVGRVLLMPEAAGSPEATRHTIRRAGADVFGSGAFEGAGLDVVADRAREQVREPAAG